LIIEDFLWQEVTQALEKVADDAEFSSLIRSVSGASVVKCAVMKQDCSFSVDQR
jgi:hypothetical protein